MQVLEIHVSEVISVIDIVSFIKRVVRRLINFLFEAEEQIEEVEGEKEEVRGPPALGIQVSEEIDIKDKFG